MSEEHQEAETTEQKLEAMRQSIEHQRGPNAPLVNAVYAILEYLLEDVRPSKSTQRAAPRPAERERHS